MHFRPMPILSVLMIPGLAVLIWLGLWQWEKYETGVLRPETVLQETYDLDVTWPDQPVQFVSSVFEGQSVWRTFALAEPADSGELPQELSGGPLFVNISMLVAINPDASELWERSTWPARIEAATIAASVERGMFAPADSPGKGIWYKENAVRMAEALGLPNAQQAKLLEPDQILRIDPDNAQRTGVIDNPFAVLARLDELPPERHLGYALTWFGLAVAMIGVYIAFHTVQGRLGFGRTSDG